MSKRIEDLPRFRPILVFGDDSSFAATDMKSSVSGDWINLKDLPQRHDAKIDLPPHHHAVLCGRICPIVKKEEYEVVYWDNDCSAFIDACGIKLNPQPDWWCELLIPPPIKKDDGWELAHHGLTGE